LPELPDVEVYKNYLTYTILQKKIEDIIINDSKVLQCFSNQLKKLQGDSFCHISRHGKYCFLQTNQNYFLILHFGMTGNVKYYKNESDPEHASLIVLFSNEYKFAFINVRKLGKIFFCQDKNQFIKKMGLGPDSFSLSKSEFIKILQYKKGIIKSTLMNQKTIAGIGNIYSDEILYQSYIHPKRKTGDLSKNELSSIYKNMQKIFQVAIDIKVQLDHFPDYYLVNRRKPAIKCGLCRGTIERKKINGRSCYFCNNHQK